MLPSLITLSSVNGFFRGVELSILVSGVVFTTVYSNLMRKKRESAANLASKDELSAP